ncbi:TetR family transcriptional regulator [Mesorhizobium sp. M1C.F.Ca.ET.193.01.1.1]|uniref:TetR/AcrR family transcriptional regulator n=1 Tax=unclassified Mesorhizobium TaxID=325217 RepID=UPI000FD45614|nr:MULTISPECIES: TetR/AcrR family transcriptional regulator [unclassified Mesorhizobium]TGT01970.1 TetR family transcriptional regulator [bacterium M00.F.Ca.ET.177.01.1.1]TGQ54818.1 TetR family transcriptional regulator [Mesorhizobium sp. M1C.F.Ca.ET.210.01.1.1]TGQ73597.1 TetR family transcriptional regulator [Mesorhizobium sp. M1C.F.Ca.ET.212.01.1.1]TGR11047.1 TetR family transcriptional regulator [Mesorhizobium sp. M1C.F.Ca.ET.204.01.1.1]TGR31631.1 TetR family transcriptional regulator [Meso
MVETTADSDLLDLRKGRPAAGQDPVKRAQIIEGARRVFIDKGFEAASMNDITREAGVSKGTIYVYFANKEELFEALIEEERGTIFKNMYEVLDHFDDLRKTLVKFGTVLSAKITSAKVIQAQRTVVGASDRIPELGARFYERGPKRGHDKVMVFLNEAVERGLLKIDDVDLAAYQFTELCLAGLFRQCIFSYRTKAPSQAEIEHVVRSGVNVFLKAYGTEKLAAEERASESA